jgi:hypothetical protein
MNQDMKAAAELFPPDDAPLAPGIPNQLGIYEAARGLWMEVVEKRSFKTHRNFRGSLPHSNGIEEGFRCGPVYSVYMDDGVVDLDAGISLHERRPLRQTAVVKKLIENYAAPSPQQVREMDRTDPSKIILPLANSRMKNYCRWWLDSIGKLFICSQSALLRSKLRNAVLDVTMRETPASFHRGTIELLNWRPAIRVEDAGPLLRGRSINSAGLAYAGGQNIGHLVRDFSTFLDLIIPNAQPASGPAGEFIFVGRNEAPMRRIVNEPELVVALRHLGFDILNPGKMPLQQQVDAFRRARVVMAAHGAGLTNILFCRPGTTLIEIFPEGGVHGSAFSRIASHLGFDYYYIAGQRIENSKSAKNPINADIQLDIPSVQSFVRQALDDSIRA